MRINKLPTAYCLLPTVAILFFLLSIFSCQSANSQRPKGKISPIEISPPLEYLVRPATVKGTQSPLLVLLHGYGDSAPNFSGIGTYFDPRLTVACLFAPQDLQNDRFAWYTIDFSTPELKGNVAEAAIAQEKILATIEAITYTHNVDPEQVYLLGFSQGTIMSLNIALTNPEKIKGALLFSGKMLDGLSDKIVDKPRLKDLQLFLTHGITDEVLGIEDGRAIHATLKALAIEDLTYSEFNAGHTIPQEQLQEAMTWLAERLITH